MWATDWKERSMNGVYFTVMVHELENDGRYRVADRGPYG